MRSLRHIVLQATESPSQQGENRLAHSLYSGDSAITPAQNIRDFPKERNAFPLHPIFRVQGGEFT